VKHPTNGRGLGGLPRPALTSEQTRGRAAQTHCTAPRRSPINYRPAARRRWPEAQWVDGEGRWALLARCYSLGISLHPTLIAAEEWKRLIDAVGCAPLCLGPSRHRIVDLEGDQ